MMPINIARGQPGASPLALRVGALVEYENAGAALLGIISGEKKGKWLVCNQRGKEVELPSDRLYLLQGTVVEGTKKEVLLENIDREAEALRTTIELEQLWEVVAESPKEYDSRELAEVLWSKFTTAQHLALRRALIQTKIFFKRKKTGFEPREASVVEELKVQVRVEEEKTRKRETKISEFLQRLKDRSTPVDFFEIEQFAALGSQWQNAKEVATFLEEVISRGSLNISGRPEEKAFRLLVLAGHFSEHENLAVHRYRRARSYPEELATLGEMLGSQAIESLRHQLEDLTHLEVITIDAEDTKDIDDGISLERTTTGYILGIHISEVASVIPVDSPLFAEALQRATSAYCPDFRIPMLPESLSEHWLSLVANESRLAMSFMIEIDANYQIVKRDIVRSVIRSTARLSYEVVDELLYSEHSNPDNRAAMVHTLWEITSRLEEARAHRGAFQIPRRELVPSLKEDGSVALQEYFEDSASRKLVGELMILANETAALFAKSQGIPLVFRSQEPPGVDILASGMHIPEGPARDYFRRGLMKRSVVSTDPLPHSSLGLDAYAQITSPIRRVVDLVNQKQLAHYLIHGESIFGSDKILELLANAQIGLDEVNSIQREGNRYWVLKYLKQENIKELTGTIVKVDGPKPLIEIELVSFLYSFHASAKRNEMRGGVGNRLGERITVRIDSLDPRKDVLVLSEIV